MKANVPIPFFYQILPPCHEGFSNGGVCMCC